MSIEQTLKMEVSNKWKTYKYKRWLNWFIDYSFCNVYKNVITSQLKRYSKNLSRDVLMIKH